MSAHIGKYISEDACPENPFLFNIPLSLAVVVVGFSAAEWERVWGAQLGALQGEAGCRHEPPASRDQALGNSGTPPSPRHRSGPCLPACRVNLLGLTDEGGQLWTWALWVSSSWVGWGTSSCTHLVGLLWEVVQVMYAEALGARTVFLGFPVAFPPSARGLRILILWLRKLEQK